MPADFDPADFDEQWYLTQYPDVRAALEQGRVPSALHHYLRHGFDEGRSPNDATKRRLIVHLHVPKTAGTSIRAAFGVAGKKLLPAGYDFRFDETRHKGIEVFSGHFGYHRASTVINGEIITILRDPIERFLSYYYHLVARHNSGAEVSERTILAAKYGIDEFLNIFDCPHIVEDVFNATVWQIAYGSRLRERHEFRSTVAATDDALLALALRNLDNFAIVGFQDELPDFCKAARERYGVELSPRRENANASRVSLDDVPMRTRQKMYRWLYLDIELYKLARQHRREIAP
jgi:hypothetical protein